MDPEEKVTVVAQVVTHALVRAARYRPELDFDAKALSDRVMPAVWTISHPKSEIKISRSDMDKINFLTELFEAYEAQLPDPKKERAERYRAEYELVREELGCMPDTLEAFAAAVEGQEWEPPVPPNCEAGGPSAKGAEATVDDAKVHVDGQKTEESLN